MAGSRSSLGGFYDVVFQQTVFQMFNSRLNPFVFDQIINLWKYSTH